jgi:hypothetical protein
MNRTRTILIHLLLASIAVSGIWIASSILRDRSSQSTRTGELLLAQLELLTQRTDENTALAENEVALSEDLISSVRKNSPLTDNEFSRKMESLLEEANLRVISFTQIPPAEGSGNEFPELRVQPGASVQAQVRGSARAFLALLRMLDSSEPWIRIERLSFRPLSSESDFEIQAEMLFSFLSISYPPDSPIAGLFEAEESPELRYSSSMESILRSLDIPARSRGTDAITDLSVIPQTPVEATGPQETMRIEYLGVIQESGRITFSLSERDSGSIFLLSSGESWQGWTLLEADTDRIYFDYDGNEWYINRE